MTLGTGTLGAGTLGAPTDPGLPVAGFAQGEIFYISLDGSNTTGDGSFLYPWRTIEYAFERVPQGALIEAFSGTYEAPSSPGIRRQAGPQSVITFRPRMDADVRTTGVWGFSSASYIRVEAVEMIAVIANHAVVISDASHHIEIFNCEIHSAQRSNVVLSRSTYGCQIQRCRIRDSGQRAEVTRTLDHGVQLAGMDHQIVNCLIHDNDADGILCYPQVGRAFIAHNTICDNGRSGVVLSGDDATATAGTLIANNIVAFNGYHGDSFGIGTDWDSIAGLDNLAERNLVHGNNDQDFYTAEGGLRVVPYDFGPSTDPLFIDRTPRGYRIPKESPAWNRAIPAHSPIFDFNDYPRDLTTPDIGALGYGSTVEVPVPLALIPVRPRWTFMLADARNLADIEPLRLARGRSVQLTLNRAGSASFDIPLSSDVAALLAPYSRAIKVYRESPNVGNQLIWSGYINTLDEDITGNRISVGAVGWMERLTKRLLRRKKVYDEEDDGVIIHDLLDEMNLTVAPDGTGYVIPVVAGSVPATPTWMQKGSLLPDEGPGGATEYVNLTTIIGPGPEFATAGRDKTYEKWAPVGPEITALTEIENGCDIYVTPDTRHLHCYRKRMVDRPSVIFGYNWGPNNIAQLGRQSDGSTLVNYFLANGVLGVTPGFQDDLPSQSLYGLIEEVVSLPEIGFNQESTLKYYAAIEVLLRSTPRITYSITPFPYAGNEGRVPEPFVDYNIGDKVYFSANWPPRVSIHKQAVRVFGISMTIDEEGNERPGPLQVSPGG